MATIQASTEKQDIAALIRVSVPQRNLRRDLRAVSIVWRRELLRFQADRLRIVSSLIQPVLFLLVLGTGLSRLAGRGMPPGISFSTFIYRACCACPSCSPRFSRPGP